MITCYLRYIIDPGKLGDFENYGKKWMLLVEKFGGIHHGYYLPHEGANNVAVALFSFSSLAAYEQYRMDCTTDPDCQSAYEFAANTGCILSYERTFLKPLLQESKPKEPAGQ